MAGSQVAVIRTIVKLVVVAGGFGDGYLLKKKGSRHPATIPVVSASTSVDDRQELFLKIARLDGEFEAGKMLEEEYHKLRSAKKTQLVELMRRRKVESDGG